MLPETELSVFSSSGLNVIELADHAQAGFPSPNERVLDLQSPSVHTDPCSARCGFDFHFQADVQLLYSELRN
jgi:hypothetical protein